MYQVTHGDEFSALEAAVRSVVGERVAGASPHPDRTASVPDVALSALDGMGLLSPRRVDDGGDGVPDQLAFTMIAEELAKGDAGTALDVIAGAQAAAILARCGSPVQRRGPASRSGDGTSARGTVLYYEGFGRSPLELETTAVATSDGWTLSGRKTGVVRAVGSEFGVAIARAEGEIAAFLLPAASLAMLRVIRDDKVTGKPGTRAAATAVVDLDGVRGAKRLENDSILEVHRAVAGWRLSVASILVGVASSAVKYAAEYASGREAFGRAIAGFQGVAFPLVDADMAVEAARLAIRDLAAALDEIDDPVTLCDGASAAVAAAVQAASAATITAVNTLGGHGYLTDHPVERSYRDVAVLAALDFDPLTTDWSASR